MLAVALPMIVSLSCDTVMTFTDRWFLSRLSENLMNASFAGGLAGFSIQTFFIGLIGYSTALVAQQFGANHHFKAVLAGVQALWIALLAWPILLLCIPVGKYLFQNIGLPANQIVPQTEYFQILVYGSIFGLCRGAFAGYFSGIGRTRVVMIASLSAMISNIFLVWIFVFGHFGMPAMGIKGAAIGTVCAGAIGLAVLVAYWFGHTNRLIYRAQKIWKFEKELFMELVKKGTPSGAEFFLNMLAFQTIVFLFQRQSPESATAATIMFNWDMVSFVPLVGMEIGTTSLVGRYMGAKDIDAVKRTLWSGLKLGWMFSGFVFIAFLVFPGFLVDIFRPELVSISFNEARDLAIQMMRIASIYIGIEAVMLVYTGALRGSGDTLYTMCATVGLHWLLVLSLWITLEVYHLGTIKGWIVLVVIFMLFPIVLGIRWHLGKWKKTITDSTIPTYA